MTSTPSWSVPEKLPRSCRGRKPRNGQAFGWISPMPSRAPLERASSAPLRACRRTDTPKDSAYWREMALK